MSARGLLRELSLRRPGDLFYRGYTAFLARTGLLRRRLPPVDPDPRDLLGSLDPGSGATLEDVALRLDARVTPRFFVAPSPFVGPLAAPRSPSGLVAEAERIVGRRFSACGSPEVSFGAAVDWHHALHTDRRWPRVYWTDVPYKRLGDLGDIKACWEWNRHACFVTLGRAYRATGDERYVEAFQELLLSWIDQNPPERGVHWISNLEIGLRCLAWLWAHHLMAPSAAYRTATRGRLHLHLFYMARHLARNLAFSAWTARNNHLIGDAACLAIVALAYPELTEARAWRARALEHLWRAVDEQVHPDGMHFEMSFGYHQLVLELLLQVIGLLRRHGEAPPARALQIVEAMLDVVLHALQPDGTLPNIGDDDGGTALPFSDRPEERIATLLAIGTALFERGDFKAAAGRFPEAAGWLLGRDGAETFARVAERAPPSAPILLERSGLCIVRSGRGPRADWALLDNHVDPFPKSGHGHAALLQLLLVVQGRPVLIDGGTYRYGGDGGFRNVLRGTAAHSTIVVDGESQATPVRAFGWLSRVRPRRLVVEANERYVLIDGAHDSYRTLRAGPVSHRRIVLWLREPGVWLVHDALEGAGAHRFQQFWHFPAEGRIDASGDDRLLVKLPDGLEVTVRLLQSDRDEIQTHLGDAAARWSWESPVYGVLRPRLSVCREWRDDLSAHRSARAVVIGLGGADPGRIDVAGGVLSLYDGRVRLHVDGERARCTDER